MHRLYGVDQCWESIRSVLPDVEWGELDYLLLDLPPGTGDVALDIHQMLPHQKKLL